MDMNIRRIQVFSIVSVCMTLFGCATQPITGEDESVLQAAIQENKAQLVRNLVASKPDLSSQPYLLDHAFEGNDSSCRTEIVGILVQKGIVPSNSDEYEPKDRSVLARLEKNPNNLIHRVPQLDRAIYDGCPEIIQMIAPLLPDEQVGVGADHFVTWFDENVPKNRDLGPGRCPPDPMTELVSKMLKDADVLIPFVERACNSGSSQSCLRLERLNDRKKMIADTKAARNACIAQQEKDNVASKEKMEAEQAQQIARQNSLEAIKEQACEADAQVKLADEQLAHQDAVEAASGVRNLSARNELGQMKVYGQENLKKLKAKYQSKTGHDPNLMDCKRQ